MLQALVFCVVVNLLLVLGIITLIVEGVARVL